MLQVYRQCMYRFFEYTFIGFPAIPSILLICDKKVPANVTNAITVAFTTSSKWENLHYVASIYLLVMHSVYRRCNDVRHWPIFVFTAFFFTWKAFFTAKCLVLS